MKYPLLIILALSLAIHIPFAFSWHEIWWDSGVYIGMGKNIYSAGENGLWEHIRPPLVPLILGLFWKIGLDPVLFGRLFEIALMLGIVWLTYQLALKWFGEKTAIIASLIVALSPILYYLSFHQYTEIPSTFLVLLALWLFTKEKYLWAGIATGTAFLAKFPAGIFIAMLLFTLAINKKWKNFWQAGAGFAVIVIPYFLWSWTIYGNPLATFTAAQDTISRALGCNVLRHKPWWQYFSWLAFSETKLHFLAIIGIFALWKRWKKEYLLFALCLALPAMYFMQLNCRDYRYLALFLPFAAILTALGVTFVYDKFNFKKKWVFTALVIILGVWMLNTTIQYYYGNELQQPDITAEKYYGYISDKEITGEIWISNPIVAAHTDKKLEKIYYPIFNSGISGDFTEYIKLNSDQIGAVMLDNCGGGIICPPEDKNCPIKIQELIQELDTKFTRIMDETTGNCWYRIWTTSATSTQ